MRPLSSRFFQRFNVIPAVPIALLMRRFCFLLLAFLFPLQLFAGTLEPLTTADEAIVSIFDAASHGSDSAAERADADADADADSLATVQTPGDQADASLDPWKVQADLEDQTLPVPVATLPLDWQPFPHLYPCVSGGTSAFIDLLRPPPAA